MATQYVDSFHGSDSTGDGTNPATPYATISAAVSAATSGDTVKFSGFFKGETIADIGKDIIFEGYSREQSIIDGNGDTSSGIKWDVLGSTNRNITLKNCTVRNYPISGNATFMGGEATAQHQWTFENILFYNMNECLDEQTRGGATIVNCDFDTFNVALSLNEFSGNATISNTSISSCTFINPASTSSVAIDAAYNYTVTKNFLSITNCIFGPCVWVEIASTPSPLDVIKLSNYNSMDSTNGARAKRSTTTYTLSAWQAFGFDLNSIDSVAEVLDQSLGIYGVDKGATSFSSGLANIALGGTGKAYGLSSNVNVGEGAGVNLGIDWDMSAHNSANPTNKWVISSSITQDPSGNMPFKLTIDPTGQVTTPVISLDERRIVTDFNMIMDENFDLPLTGIIAGDTTNVVETSPLRNPLSLEYRYSNSGVFSYNESESTRPFTEVERGVQISPNGIAMKHFQLRFTLRNDFK